MRTAVLAAFLIGGGTVQAATCFVPYEEFEKLVPHVDLRACPGSAVANDEVFCRLALDGERVRVYRFRSGADGACLEQIETYVFAEFAALFGTTQPD